jgi:hypothetical protein
MKKYRIYILASAGAGILALSITLYFFFQTPFSAWNLVPNSAMLVLETTNLPTAYKDLQKRPIWKNLKNAPFLQVVQQRFEYFLKTVEKASHQHPVWENKRVTLSMHWVGKEDFDAIFYIPITEKQDQQIYQQALASFAQQNKAKFVERSLNGLTLTEVTIEETEERFAYFVHHNYWVGSFSPLLLEDVLRKVASGEPSYNFPQSSQLKRILRKSELAFAPFELYLNLPKLSEGLGKIFADHIPQEIKSLGELGTQTYLRLQGQNNLAWEGYTFQNKAVDIQQGLPFELTNYIPQNAYLAYAISLDQPQKWAGERKSLQEVLKNIAGNITLAYLTNEGKDEGSLLFVRPTKPLSFLSAVQNFVRENHKDVLPTTDREQVGNFALQEIAGWKTLRNELKINALQNFEKAYFAVVGQYVVIAHDRFGLKQYLRDLQDKKTWDRLPSFSTIAPTLKKPSAFTLVANLPLLWSMSYDWVSPKFQMLLSIYENEAKSSGWLVWQNETQETQLLTRLQLFPSTTLPISVAEDTTKSDYTLRQQVNFADLLYTQPFLVSNAETGETEILVQDFRKNLYLLNDKGKVLWKRNMGAQLVGKPLQVDIYNNNRIQYTWSAGNKLYLIDRLGRNVSGFPVSMTDTTSHLQGISVLDVQKNKNYWFTGCDERGRLFVLSKQVQWVAGWNPKRLTYRLGTPLQGVSIKDAHCYIAVQENGQIHAFNAKGETLPNFPLYIKQRFTAEMHIESAQTLASTIITTVSEDGKLVQFNLVGKLLKEEQLERPSGRSKFILLQDAKKENYWFAVTTEDTWQLMDRNGKKIMEDAITDGIGKWEIQIFEPQNDVFIVAVTNKAEGKTALYDMRGKMLGEPIQSNAPIGLRYDKAKKQLLIYKVLGNKLAILAKNWN